MKYDERNAMAATDINSLVIFFFLHETSSKWRNFHNRNNFNWNFERVNNLNLVCPGIHNHWKREKFFYFNNIIGKRSGNEKKKSCEEKKTKINIIETSVLITVILPLQFLKTTTTKNSLTSLIYGFSFMRHSEYFSLSFWFFFKYSLSMQHHHNGNINADVFTEKKTSIYYLIVRIDFKTIEYSLSFQYRMHRKYSTSTERPKGRKKYCFKLKNWMFLNILTVNLYSKKKICGFVTLTFNDYPSCCQFYWLVQCAHRWNKMFRMYSNISHVLCLFFLPLAAVNVV